MYVLDTNAFFYAAEISKCTYDISKLQNLIDDNEVFISSTTLFEFLIKYRNNIDVIHKGGTYLWKKQIKIAGNKINPLPEEFIGNITNIMNINESELDSLCNHILNNKIEVEGKFISLLFDMCLFSGFYFSVMSDGEKPSEFCIDIFRKIYVLFSVANDKFFMDAFTEGYATNDCENYVKDCFYNLLADELEKGIPLVERAKEINDNEISNMDQWISLKGYSNDIGKLSNKMKTKTSTAFLHRLAVKYWNNNDDPELKNYIQEIKKTFDKKIKLRALQDYFYDTLIGIMTRGASIKKNDLLDAIILCNVQDAHVMITYDNGVIKRIDKRKSEYSKYLESINLINQLKQ